MLQATALGVIVMVLRPNGMLELTQIGAPPDLYRTVREALLIRNRVKEA